MRPLAWIGFWIAIVGVSIAEGFGKRAAMPWEWGIVVGSMLVGTALLVWASRRARAERPTGD